MARPQSGYNEWHYKPCWFVSYGGISGGLRSAQVARQLVTTLKMMPMVDGVMVQMPWEKLDVMVQWATALKSLR
ncbi:MAG: NAD(P)H-dependent oxidoreductase [Marinobacter sp.]|uniref:NADPH-dependent FMN reductase n=1 Tax=Marinobacter sp. TaxID=50741 RepID=UPI003296BE96